MMPTFVIIGAMKCGTTSLHHYLRDHPEICMSRIKETDYFLGGEEFARGQAWYESQFSRAAKARGEASPNYTKPWLFPRVAERMAAAVPEARLIYLVRDPIERMISHYKHRFADCRERRPLNEALADRERNPYLNCCRYYRNVEPFLDYFPRDRLLIVASEELRHDRQPTLRRVLEFVAVDPAFTGRSLRKEFHRAERKFRPWGNLLGRLAERLQLARFSGMPNPPCKPEELTLDEGVRRWLLETLLPDVALLEQLAGRTFDAWNLSLPPQGEQHRRAA
jgi:hypothetical protein